MSDFGKEFWERYFNVHDKYCICVNDDAYGMKYDYNELKNELLELRESWIKAKDATKADFAHMEFLWREELARY